MIVLDTNIGSEFTKRDPNFQVVDWVEHQVPKSLWICTPVIMEHAYGAERYSHANRSSRLIDMYRLLHADFEDRILSFDAKAAYETGKIRAYRQRIGRPIGIPDSMIAAICIVNGATLATRNVRDFDGLDLKLVNPFEAAG